MNVYEYYITPEEYERAAAHGVCSDTLEYRVRQGGWIKERAITTPPQRDKSGWHEVKHIAVQHGICRQTFRCRRKKGMALMEAATKPPMSRQEIVEAAKSGRRIFKNTLFTDEQIERAVANGISYATLRRRVVYSKWDVEEAITTPILTPTERSQRSYWRNIRFVKKPSPKTSIILCKSYALSQT